MEFIYLFILGGFVGFMSSFFGIGGGSLIVPVLYSLYPKAPSTIVIPISLGTIFIITLINTFKFARLKLTPSGKAIAYLSISCIVGAYIGAQLTYLIDTALAKKLMSGILVFIIIKLLFFSKPQSQSTKITNSPGKLSLTGLSGSLISSITGLGGGIVFTPMFISLIKLPLKNVSPYSNVAMVSATLIGTLPHIFSNKVIEHGLPEKLAQFFLGNVNYAFILIIAFSAYFSSTIGIKYNNSVAPELKKKLLAGLIAVLAAKLLFS